MLLPHKHSCIFIFSVSIKQIWQRRRGTQNQQRFDFFFDDAIDKDDDDCKSWCLRIFRSPFLDVSNSSNLLKNTRRETVVTHCLFLTFSFLLTNWQTVSILLLTFSNFPVPIYFIFLSSCMLLTRPVNLPEWKMEILTGKITFSLCEADCYVMMTTFILFLLFDFPAQENKNSDKLSK